MLFGDAVFERQTYGTPGSPPCAFRASPTEAPRGSGWSEDPHGSRGIRGSGSHCPRGPRSEKGKRKKNTNTIPTPLLPTFFFVQLVLLMENRSVSMVNTKPFLVEGRHHILKKVGIGCRGHTHTGSFPSLSAQVVLQDWLKPKNGWLRDERAHLRTFLFTAKMAAEPEKVTKVRNKRSSGREWISRNGGKCRDPFKTTCRSPKDPRLHDPR